MQGARPSIQSDVDYLAPRLRPEDVAEVRANSGFEPHFTLSLGLLYSDKCFTMVTPDGEPVGMFGVGKSNMPNTGIVWMLNTPLLEKHRVQFLRACKAGEWVDVLHEKYPILTNAVDERNTKHIRWLRWLGFTFVFRHPFYGVERRPFIEFVRLSNNV